VRCYTLAEVCNRLLASGLRIRRAGRRRDWAQLILTPVTACASLLRRGTLMGGRVWDLCGFADYVWGAKVNGAGPR
ncbi:MAG: hypothetical protein ACRD2F_13820, partial [Terriglobales bacterium]